MAQFLSAETKAELASVAQRLARAGCGVLAADETPMAMEDRFKDLDVENSAENRRRYRNLLFTASSSDLAALSGVILNDETVHQKMDDGRGFVDALNDMGIVTGVTLDKGWRQIPSSPVEVFTQGMDDLSDRCASYKALGLKFCKWRMVVEIRGEELPSELAISEGARTMALYASICQSHGLVPIVEPDINRQGSHSIARMQRVHERVVAAVYDALARNDVWVEGTVLKVSMVTAGKQCPQGATAGEVGSRTRASLLRRVPPSVPLVVFLSGGLTDVEATVDLNAVNGGEETLPWRTTFCFGRALQGSTRKVWNGLDSNVAAAQKEFAKRVRLNGLASEGKYTGE